MHSVTEGQYIYLKGVQRAALPPFLALVQFLRYAKCLSLYLSKYNDILTGPWHCQGKRLLSHDVQGWLSSPSEVQGK